MTRPGGRAAIVMWNGLDRMEHVQVWLEAVASAVPRFEPTPTPENWAFLQKPESLQRVIGQAGFAEVEIRIAVRHWRLESAAWFAAHADLSPVAEGLYRTLGPDVCGAVRGVLERRLRAGHGNGAITLAAEAHIAVGVR